MDRWQRRLHKGRDIAGPVAPMTEIEPGVPREMASNRALGCPGQRHEAGKALSV